MQITAIVEPFPDQLGVRCFSYMNSFNIFKQFSEMGLIIISILQMKKLNKKTD